MLTRLAHTQSGTAREAGEQADAEADEPGVLDAEAILVIPAGNADALSSRVVQPQQAVRGTGQQPSYAVDRESAPAVWRQPAVAPSAVRASTFGRQLEQDRGAAADNPADGRGVGSVAARILAASSRADRCALSPCLPCT